MNLSQLAGRHLMIGVPGTRVTPQTTRLFQKTQAAGLIVFRPNFASAESFRKFLAELEEKIQRRLIVAVDHEGGRVIHLREGITVFPDNWTLGNTGCESYAAKQGMIEAKELRRLGIDLNLAPTLDVLRENFSPNIGIRSYGKNPELVARFGAARIKAMQKEGLSACAKHFPGLGPATLDPHLDLPVLGAGWKEMEKIHLKPFLAAIKAGVDTMMTSHPVYPKLDPLKIPVTFSKRIVRDFLRRELGYQGVILSDDLEMGALKGICPVGESAVRAVEAGHDMVLICHEGRACEEAHDFLLAAYRSGRLKIRDLEASSARIGSLLSQRAERFSGKPCVEKEGPRLAEKIAREGITVRGRISKIKEAKVIFPKLSSLASKIHIEEECRSEKAFIRKLFAEEKIKVSVQTISLNPSAKEAGKVLAWSRARISSNEEPVIFFCYDAHQSKETEKLLKQIQSRGKNAVIVLLRDPYGAAFVKKQAPVITVYGFRVAQLRAAVREIGKNLK